MKPQTVAIIGAGTAELAQPEVGLYIAGMKSYGRAPTFLMITGYEQVRSIIADIVGDKEGAALQKQLSLNKNRTLYY